MTKSSIFKSLKENIYSCAYQVCIRPTEEKRKSSAVDVIWVISIFITLGLIFNLVNLYQQCFQESIELKKNRLSYIVGVPFVVIVRVMISKVFKNTSIVEVKIINQIFIYCIPVIVIVFVVLSGVYYGNLYNYLN